jgi:predicted negative regulator of RcsB-dependent stress response
LFCFAENITTYGKCANNERSFLGLQTFKKRGDDDVFTGARTQFFSSDTLQQGRVASAGGKRPIFEETSERAIRAAHRRKWTVVGTVVLVVAIGAGLLTYSWSKSRAERALAQAFIDIEALQQNENKSFEEKLRADPKLNTPDARPDHSESAKKFEEFAKANPNVALGWNAALRAANTFIEQQKYAEAQALLEPLLIKTLKHVVFQVRVRKTLAGLLAEQGKLDPALEQLSVLEKLPDNPLIAETRLMQAQLLYKKGDKEQAGKILRELAANNSAAAEGTARSVASEASLWLGFWGL